VLLSIVAISMTCALGGAVSAESDGYLRYPDIHGDRVVFVAEADVWIAPVSGGAARRITVHPGGELLPKFSPDGRWIAFSGRYDGNTDVFVVSSDGGEPRRLTWHPGGDEVIGWTPDGRQVVFRSSREEPLGRSELFLVPAKGGDISKMPLGWAARIDIDPESGRYAFTRTQRERRTWKRYRGGTATKIWVGDPAKGRYEQINRFIGMNSFPMWHDGRIYCLSDQGGTANIWSMQADGTDRRKHTKFDTWDARFPSMGSDGRIVFMLAGDIQLFDPADGSLRKIDIELRSDRVLTRGRYPDVERYVTWFDLSPDGERIALTTRGEIFSIPVKKGVTLPVTRGSGARESWGSFSPDGKTIVYVTDENSEEEIRTIDAWGRGEPTTVKEAGKRGWHFPPRFSPDGKWIAYSDETQTLYVIPAEGGKPTKVDRSEQQEIRSFDWSPDSRWLAYEKAARSDYRSVFIYDLTEKKAHRVTGDETDDYSPAWDPEGRYLHFLSDRTTNPMLGSRDMRDVNIRPTKPYLALLRADVENPFAELAGRPPEEEEEKEEEGDKKEDEKGKDEEGKGEGKEKEVEPVEIELEGLSERIVAYPVDAGNYGGLLPTKKSVFYFSMPLRGMADMPGLFAEGGPIASLMVFDLESKKAKTFMSGVMGAELSGDGEKIAVMKRRGEIYVVGTGAPPGEDLGESKVSLDGVVIELDPIEEWTQIYNEGWRHMRDFYWDSGMGGLDWEEIRDQYATLLPRLSTRDDLRDLMGEVIGELSTSHTYVFGGDYGPRVPGVATGLLGADLVREGDSFRIERIYRGSPPDNEPSPLLEPGVNIQEGNYILAVNGLPFDEDRPFLAALEELAGKRVMLTVNDSDSRDGARDVVVVALRGERGLRYADWVRRNREHVAEETDGKMGYIHIPNMMGPGLIEFNTWFYPQIDKEGMVVDCRSNGGGFVSQIVLERFYRQIVSFDRSRGGGISTYPYRTLNGPFVVLTDQFAGSDGDIFPAAVQLLGLAPVIGQRSWGGVVGIRGDKRMVDGGFLTQPEFAWWDPKSGWGLENRGVIPDIEVVNLPQEVAAGVDSQLDRAISETVRLHGEHPPVEPDFGPARPRSRTDYRGELGTP
jgi:tricorn protease